jgi:FkbM family methyltransferase
LLAKPVLSKNQQQHIYDKHKNDEVFSNDADFQGILRLIHHSDFCTRNNSYPILIAGVNEGQFMLNVLKNCPHIEIRGFEIQTSVFLETQSKVLGRSNVRLYNMGWGEKFIDELKIGGSGGTAGLFNTVGTGFHDWGMQKGTASVVSLSEWSEQANISETLYVVIDTEGYEPKVLRGMHLQEEVNQRRFPHLQYELGGTWASRDPRHGGTSEWSQYAAAAHMSLCGYMLFLIGRDKWMHVDPEFFQEGPHMKEENGKGLFVQGNLLCLHSKYSNPTVVHGVLSLLVT